MYRNMGKMVLLVFLSASLAGCTFIFQSGRRSDMQKIDELSRQLEELTKTRSSLESKLAQEIQDKQVSLKMMEKGMVITVVGDLVFDSGKAKVRSQAYGILHKVAGILQDEAAQFKVGIEGHTDNVPIKVSGWKSNWELSTSRSLNVLHHMVEKEGISPERLSAIGYGEFSPVAPNDSREGRQANRRVEIVIFPNTTKVKGEHPAASSQTQEPYQGNLK